MYESNIDLDAVTAIDTHVHIEADDCGHAALPQPLLDAADAYFKRTGPSPTIVEIADYYRELSMAAVVFTVDSETNMKTPPNSSEEIALGAARNNDVLIPFASVDPLQGQRAVDKPRALVDDFGVRRFRFRPRTYGCAPTGVQFSPPSTHLEEYGLPVIFHTGRTGIWAGMPGGFGLRLSLSNPMYLDDLAAWHPNLPII